MRNSLRISPLLTVLLISTPNVDAAKLESSATAPNVVLIVADDLGWSDLHCYGNEWHESPRLDQLAAQGLRFTNAYAAAPVCSPTRASIMTGQYPARLHMTVWHEAAVSKPKTNRPLTPPQAVGNLPLELTTLAEHLKNAGYSTLHVGKWHLGTATYYPENQGFDVNIGGTFWGAPATFFWPFSGEFGRAAEPRYVPGLPLGQLDEYLTDRLTDEAIRLLKHPSDKPVFLHLCYHSVHTPIEAKPHDVQYFKHKPPQSNRHRNPTYAAMVRSLDENVGRLLDTIDGRPSDRSTLVIFTSDNGGFINSHRHMRQVTSNAPLRSGKGALYEGGIRVPLIVRWPGQVPTDTTCDQPVCTIDFLPTLLDLIDAPRTTDPTQVIDGISLAQLLVQPDQSLPKRPLFFHYPHYYPSTTPVGAIRDGRWKLLEYFEDGRLELFDLQTDLGEQTNLATQNSTKADELHQKLVRWREDVRAQMPTRSPNH